MKKLLLLGLVASLWTVSTARAIAQQSLIETEEVVATQGTELSSIEESSITDETENVVTPLAQAAGEDSTTEDADDVS